MSSVTDVSEALGVHEIVLPAARGVVAPRENLVQTSMTDFVSTPFTKPAKRKYLHDFESDEIDSEMYSDDESYYSTFTDIDFDGTPYWEREGALLRHRESSYLHRPRPYSRRDQHGRTVYDWYTPADLKSFVNARYLRDPYPNGVTLKYSYLRILEKADKQWRFRLMDLPPEMRLLVYRELLLFNDISTETNRLRVGKVYPAILRASTEINAEAHRVLYDENTFTALFRATGGDDGKGQGLTSCVHSQYFGAVCHHARFVRIPKGIDDYPEFFRRISRLEVRLYFQTKGTISLFEKATWPLNHFLYTLASFLMDGHRLKKLHIKLDISSRVDDSAYGTILYPMRRLRNVAQVTIEGHVPNNIRTKLVRDLESTEPSFNTLRYWKLIEDDAQAQLAIHEAMHEEVDCACGECPMPDCMEEIFFRTFHLQNMSMDSCFSSRQEEHFMAHLATMRKFIDRAKAKDLTALVDELIRKREALKAYEAVSDEGRLEEAAKIWAGKEHNHSLKCDPEEDWKEDSDGTAIDKIEEDVEITDSQRGEAEAAVQNANADGTDGAAGTASG